MKSNLENVYSERELNTIIFLVFNQVLGWDKITFRQGYDFHLSESELLLFNAIVKRLKQHEPIQYILGKTEFFGLSFEVNSSVLIPRPETEELVERIISENKNRKELSILDIGTGSGCIAIALKKHLPQAKITAIDVSEEALETAKKNADLNGVGVKFIHQNILLPFKSERLFDVIVSNPPYITQDEKALMHNNVLDYEPHLALFVEDAMQFYRAILEFSKHHISSGGIVYFELNEHFDSDYISLFSNYSQDFQLIKDVQNKSRIGKLNF